MASKMIRHGAIRSVLFPNQHAIAKMLSVVDRKIHAEERRKAALDALFKTLLQHLMTGKVRIVDATLGAGSEPASTAPAPTDMPRVRAVMRDHNPMEGEA